MKMGVSLKKNSNVFQESLILRRISYLATVSAGKKTVDQNWDAPTVSGVVESSTK